MGERGRKKGDGLPKTGGRQAGTPNKITTKLRDVFSKFTEDKFSDFEEAWGNLEDKDKCETYLKMSKFVVPSLSSIELNDNTEKTSKVEALIKDLRDKEKDSK